MKQTYDLMQDFNKFYAYIIGVDEAEINLLEKKVVCKYTKESKKYACMKLALSLIDSYDPKDQIIQRIMIQDIINYFEDVMKTARKRFNNKLLICYDKETQDVIDKLYQLLGQKN